MSSKKVEITSSSTESSDQTVRNAVAKVGQPMRNIDWFEVTEVRGEVKNNTITHRQVTVKIGFR